MGSRLLEAGIIVNTHGIRGEVRIQPWADSPAFLSGFKQLYIDGKKTDVVSARVHKTFVIALFDGITDIDSAIRLKNKIVSIDRDKVLLDEGQYFIADLVGLSAVDFETNELLGTVAEVLPMPANNVYVIKGAREILVPAVPDFVKEINTAEGFIKIRMMTGL